MRQSLTPYLLLLCFTQYAQALEGGGALSLFPLLTFSAKHSVRQTARPSVNVWGMNKGMNVTGAVKKREAL